VADPRLVDGVEAIVIAGVAMTNASLARAATGIDLTFPQWRVMVILGAMPAGAPVHEIAQAIAVTLPATGRQLRRLARKGLLSLEPAPDDRRVTWARLTKTGADVLATIMADRRTRIATALRTTTVDATVTDAVGTIGRSMTADLAGSSDRP